MIDRFACLVLCIALTAFNSNAKEVLVGMGRSVPPYIIQEKNAGAEYEIIEAALKAVGHELKPVYLPLARVEQMLTQHEVDGTTPLLKRQNSHLCYSESHITYQNVVISLKKNEITVSGFNDLRNRRIIAFQKARLYLGEGFASAVNNNQGYEEYPDQNKQVHALFGGLTDLIVADKNIFTYYVTHSKRKANFGEYVLHPIFPPSHYSVGFVDAQLCENFNRGLAIIQKQQLDRQIKLKYNLLN